MKQFSAGQDFLTYLYDIENDAADVFARFDYSFSPVLICGQVADPGLYM
jgi:hypothetical protein